MQTLKNLEIWTYEEVEEMPPVPPVDVDFEFDAYAGDAEQPSGVSVALHEVRTPDGKVIAKAADPRGWQWKDVAFVQAINAHFGSIDAFVSLQYSVKQHAENIAFGKDRRPTVGA